MSGGLYQAHNVFFSPSSNNRDAVDDVVLLMTNGQENMDVN